MFKSIGMWAITITFTVFLLYCIYLWYGIVKIILDVFGLNMEKVLCKIIGIIISAIIGTIVLIVIYSILYYIIGRDLCILALHVLFGGYCSLFE